MRYLDEEYEDEKYSEFNSEVIFGSEMRLKDEYLSKLIGEEKLYSAYTSLYKDGFFVIVHSEGSVCEIMYIDSIFDEDCCYYYYIDLSDSKSMKSYHEDALVKIKDFYFNSYGV